MGRLLGKHRERGSGIVRDGMGQERPVWRWGKHEGTVGTGVEVDRG